MKPSRLFLRWAVLAIGALLSFLAAFFLLTWTYTTVVLHLAEREGTFSSAEDGMNALIARAYVHPHDTQIIYAGTNSFDGSQPHVWYVIACVWGGTRADGSPVGTARHAYDQPGTFFVATREGWVHVGEGYFPEVLGFWLKFYGLAGPGSSTPSHDWGSTPTKGCNF